VKRAILLVDHGSSRREANELLERLAELVAERLPEAFVSCAHMDLAEPTIAQGIETCAAAGVEEIVVHPYFLGPGNHSSNDIPRLVRAAASKHPGLAVRITGPLGLHPKLIDVILDRVDETGP
jgi:sirohydrochlorin ferrochelatase